MARVDHPLEDSGIDSFDLISLRTTLEMQTGCTIPDPQWNALTRLPDIPRLPNLSGTALTSASVLSVAPASTPAPRSAVAPASPLASPTPGRAHRGYQVNMPQLALPGLSESWLFKEVGDLHWQVITEFLQSPSSAIADADSLPPMAKVPQIGQTYRQRRSEDPQDTVFETDYEILPSHGIAR